jgi:hypothetical protein
MENLALIDSFSEFKDDKLIDRVTWQFWKMYLEMH